MTPKHRFYFNRLRAAEKAFVPFFYRFSDTLSEVVSYARIPREIRRSSYDCYLISSFVSLAFALLERRLGAIATFDDGLVNLDRALFESFVRAPGRIGNGIRRVAGARSTEDIIASSTVHYTIFRPDEVQMPVRNPQHVDLLSASELKPRRKEEITVLLGTRVDLSPHPRSAATSEHFRAWRLDFDRLKRELDYDIYLPHPSAGEEPALQGELAGRGELRNMLETHIAEDVVLDLVKAGAAVRIYGVASTALLMLRDYASCINVVIPDYNSDSAARFSTLGVPSISVDEVLLAASGPQHVRAPRGVR